MRVSRVGGWNYGMGWDVFIMEGEMFDVCIAYHVLVPS